MVPGIASRCAFHGLDQVRQEPRCGFAGIKGLTTADPNEVLKEALSPDRQHPVQLYYIQETY
jgi:hypothetical protein